METPGNYEVEFKTFQSVCYTRWPDCVRVSRENGFAEQFDKTCFSHCQVRL